MSGTHHTYEVQIRLPQGNYVTLTISAVNQVAAQEMARALGGTVARITQVS